MSYKIELKKEIQDYLGSLHWTADSTSTTEIDYINAGETKMIIVKLVSMTIEMYSVHVKYMSSGSKSTSFGGLIPIHISMLEFFDRRGFETTEAHQQSTKQCIEDWFYNEI